MKVEENKPSKNKNAAPFFEDRIIIFEQKHWAQKFINKFKSNGFLKNCANIALKQERDCDGIIIGFQVDCSEKSFEFDHGDCFEGCPDDCLSFRDAKWVARKELFLKILNYLDYFRLPFRWFFALSWQTQIWIIVLLILFFSPRWSKPLIEIIKAFK